MVRVEKVNKYFNRFKKNQIHAINNAEIEFENKGLVAILGNSGCGKTTLLNAIGGLDKVNSGKIYVNGKRITKRRSSTVDKIRAVNIGYIFQNYNLINYLTVFENVALALKISGIKNKEEIKYRVNYILELLGIYKYRNRLANMLSGGEKQRVAIARALVKQPNIIIADEPTGNLDSKNTIEIMNIIKAISKEKLVILVTHERNLAEFYASRIIEIVDGKIVNDCKNEHANDLDYKIENKIYLKDFKKHETFNKDNANIELYQNDENTNLDIKIIMKNGNLYIQSNQKTEIVDENSAIELINEHYKKMSKEEAEKYKFDYEKMVKKQYKMKYSSIFNPITLLINGFKKIFDYSILKKLLLVGFIASSMFILYGISNIFGTTNIKDEKFLDKNAEYLEMNAPNLKVEKFLEYENLESIDYILPGSSTVQFYIKYYDYYQTKDAQDTAIASISAIDLVQEQQLMYGRMPENNKEVVLDKLVLEKIIANSYNGAKTIGIKNVEQFLNRYLTFGNYYGSGRYGTDLGEFKIVGIISKNSPCIYVNREMFTNIIFDASNEESNIIYLAASTTNEQSTSQIGDYNLVKSKIQITKGREPQNDYEIIVNESNSSIMKLNKTVETQINGIKLKVVGYYKSKYNLNNYYTNLNTIKYSLIEKNTNFTIQPKNKQEAINYLRNDDIYVEEYYQKAKQDYIKQIKDSIISSLVIAGVIILISLIEIYLMIRSSFLSRIKEVGTLRAIGVKKIDIYKMFLGEILAITIISGGIGITIMSYIIKGLTQVSYFNNSLMFNWQIIAFAISIFTLFNIIVGLLPVRHTIKKTPAEILSSNNVD